jgi:hypothetical protein
VLDACSRAARRASGRAVSVPGFPRQQELMMMMFTGTEVKRMTLVFSTVGDKHVSVFAYRLFSRSPGFRKNQPETSM